MTERAFVCRCEDVSTREIEHAIDQGMRTIEEIKRYTGLGTGPCQGKECSTAIARYLLARGLASPTTIRPFTARPPAVPVTFGALAELDEETLVELTLRTHRAKQEDEP